MSTAFKQFLGFARRNPLMVASLAVILVLGSVSYFLWQHQQTLAADHDEVRRSGEDMLQSLTGHARITTEIATVTGALDFIDRNLINEADLAENLGYFYQIETLTRIRFSQINQLSSQPQPPGSPYKAVPFALRATGSYRQIMFLLRQLETGPRLLRIRTFSLTGGDGATDSVTLDVTVELLARP